MTDPSKTEDREFSRIPIKMEVKVNVSGGECITSSEIKDVSMKGLFLVSGNTLPEGSECDVAMQIGEPENPLHIDVKGKVDRSTDNGMAIQFTEIGLESYDHLHNLVLYNSKNTDQVEQEFKSHLGLKRRE